MLRRIFGKGTSEDDKRVEQSVNQVENGEYNKIYPILKPGDWVGIQSGAIKQTLVGDQENPIVVIGFGFDTPDNFIFLTHKHLEERPAEEILNEAYHNLDQFDTTFEKVKSLDNRVLTSSGLDFSSERILNQKHMLKAHELLNAEELYVSIPRRRCMMVTSARENEELLNQFVYLHKSAWEENSYGNPPISNLLFVLKDGIIGQTIGLKNK